MCCLEGFDANAGRASAGVIQKHEGDAVDQCGVGAGVEYALLDRQISTDSAMFENPFRAGGELSKDAANIIDALKTGKLDEVAGEPQENGHQKKNQLIMISIILNILRVKPVN